MNDPILQNENIPIDDFINDIIDTGDTIILIGGIDTGKTTLCTRIADMAFERKLKTAVVDSDVGQSEIGPPTTIGMGFVSLHIKRLHDIHPDYLYFIGQTTPVGKLRDMAKGTAKLVNKAKKLGALLILVDTTGFVSGPMAKAHKIAKISAVKPKQVIAIHKNNELDHIVEEISEDILVRCIRVSEMVLPKTTIYRRQNRKEMYSGYFQNAGVVQLPIEKFKSRIRDIETLKNLVVGLIDSKGFALGIGTISTIEENYIGILTPVKYTGKIWEVQPGHIKILPNGKEVSERK